MDGGSGNDIYIIGTDALSGTDSTVDAGGDDVLLFDGLDPFASVDSVYQYGTDLVLHYAGGGSLTLLWRLTLMASW